MATFYIDYENVHHGGVSGIEQLSNMEYVFLFYSPNANSMNIETVKNMLNSRCGIEFIEADSGTANALDFQLITFLYLGIGQDDYHYIISKDHGYDAAVKMGKRIGIDHVLRFTSITEAFKHYENEKIKKEEYLCDAESEIEDRSSDFDEQIVEESIGINKKAEAAIKEKIKKIVQKESGITIPREEIEISVEGVCLCENKMSLYHYLRRNLGNKRGTMVYGAINDNFLLWQLELVG